MAPDITDEFVIVTALFHDVGKRGFPGKPYYLPNDKKGCRLTMIVHFADFWTAAVEEEGKSLPHRRHRRGDGAIRRRTVHEVHEVEERFKCLRDTALFACAARGYCSHAARKRDCAGRSWLHAKSFPRP
jgi:hypothetical protein